MNVSIHNSHSYLFAGLAAATLLACLLLIRTTNLTGPMPSLRSPAPAREVVAPVSVPQPAPAPPAAVVIPDTVASTATGITTAAVIIPAVEVLPAVEVTQNTGLSDENRAFFTQALQSGIQQDNVSRGVLARLVYPEVREYAYMVITDQTAANAELQALAARKGLTIPAPASIAFRRWGREERSIDQHYVDMLAGDNENMAPLFEKATRSDDPEIASFARRILPMIKNHLSAARDLKKMTE